MQIEAFAVYFSCVGGVFVLLSVQLCFGTIFKCAGTAGPYRPYNSFGTVFLDNIWRGSFGCCKWFSLAGNFVIFC
jgi:hypothetical protein